MTDYRTTEQWAIFCRAIGERPGDDTPRLVAADWLDETATRVPCGRCAGGGVWSDPIGAGMVRMGHCPACDGSGWVSDGRVERAEFIRVQCEIARLPLDWRTLKRSEGETKESRIKRLRDLHIRERELWPIVGPSFRPADDWDAHYDPANAGLPKFARVKRGFVAEVRGPLAALLGGACERCEGHGVTGHYIGDNIQQPTDHDEFACPDCKATARIPSCLAGLGAELWAVEACEVSAREPTSARPSGAGWWIFVRPSDPDAAQTVSDILPAELISPMACAAPGGHWTGAVVGRYTNAVRYRTEAAARAALSAGILRLARERAGMERPKARAEV